MPNTYELNGPFMNQPSFPVKEDEPTLEHIFKEIDAGTYTIFLIRNSDNWPDARHGVKLAHTATNNSIMIYGGNLAETIKRAYKALTS